MGGLSGTGGVSLLMVVTRLFTLARVSLVGNRQALPLGWVSLGKSLNLSEAQFPHLESEIVIIIHSLL